VNIHPYYVYTHDMVPGVEDLRTSLDTALHIEKHVRVTPPDSTHRISLSMRWAAAESAMCTASSTTTGSQASRCLPALQ
jgi:L-lysine 2,3-aminomutase